MRNMSDKQSVILVYSVPVMACILILIIGRGNFLSDEMNTILAYIVSITACVLTVVGLNHTANKENGWIPSFMALTTLKVLTFCAFCVYVVFGAKDCQNDHQGLFILLVTFPGLIALCLFASAFTFLLTYVVVRLVPKTSTRFASTFSKTKAVQVANLTVICIGLVLAYVAFRVS